jgi:hypothetical protein
MALPRRAMCTTNITTITALLLLIVVLAAVTDKVLGRSSSIGSDAVFWGDRSTATATSTSTITATLATNVRKALWWQPSGSSSGNAGGWNRDRNSCTGIGWSSPSVSTSDDDDEWWHLMMGSTPTWPVSFDNDDDDNDHGRHQKNQKRKQKAPKRQPQQQHQPHGSRFASINDPQEAREITFTVEPHLKRRQGDETRICCQAKSKSDRTRQRQSQHHSTICRAMADVVLLSRDNTGEEEEEEHAIASFDRRFKTNPYGRHDKPDVVVLCSARHVALQQGRFGVDESRRLIPSFSAKTATTAHPITSKKESSSVITQGTTTTTAAVAAATAAVTMTTRPLLFWENMVSGAVSRSIAQTVMHPANTMKTILQSSRGPNRPTLGDLFQPQMFRRLTRGAGANFALSIPHGAVNFAVLEFVRGRLNRVVESVPFLNERKDVMGPGLDFLSSAISTVCCSVVSTPQMMVTDVRIHVGMLMP